MSGASMRATLALALLPALGCQSDYARNRLYDALDIVPASVGAGGWVYTGVRVTSFLGTGIGAAETDRVGWCRRTPDAPADLRGPRTQWHEQATGIVFIWTRDDDPWPGAANLFFVVPQRNALRFNLFHDRPGNDFIDWGSLLDVEAELHAGVGLRIAFSPVQLADWLLGWFGIDLLGDDVFTPAPAPAEGQDPEPEPRDRKPKRSE